LEEKSLLSSSIITLANEPQHSKFEHKEIAHHELDINEDICVLNKLMSLTIDGKESLVLMAPNFFKNTYVTKGRILSTMILLRSKECPFLAWVMIFRNDASGHKDLRANPLQEGGFDVE